MAPVLSSMLETLRRLSAPEGPERHQAWRDLQQWAYRPSQIGRIRWIAGCDQDDAEDVIANALISIYENAERCRADTEAGAYKWLQTIMKSKALDWRRRETARDKRFASAPGQVLEENDGEGELAWMDEMMLKLQRDSGSFNDPSQEVEAKQRLQQELALFRRYFHGEFRNRRWSLLVLAYYATGEWDFERLTRYLNIKGIAVNVRNPRNSVRNWVRDTMQKAKGFLDRTPLD